MEKRFIRYCPVNSAEPLIEFLKNNEFDTWIDAERSYSIRDLNNHGIEVGILKNSPSKRYFPIVTEPVISPRLIECFDSYVAPGEENER